MPQVPTITGRYNQYAADTNKFIFGSSSKANHGAGCVVSTVSVPAVHWSQVPGVGAAAPGNFAAVLGCELTGANYMLTTQFTGCAFCWTNHGGVLRASHISPSGGGPVGYPGGGNALAQRLSAQGTMANAANAALTVFGAGAGNANVPAAGNPFYPPSTQFRWGSIIGVNKGGGGWRLYLQVIGNNDQIQEARRIL
jgi:hypothetical protein